MHEGYIKVCHDVIYENSVDPEKPTDLDLNYFQLDISYLIMVSPILSWRLFMK